MSHHGSARCAESVVDAVEMILSRCLLPLALVLAFAPHLALLPRLHPACGDGEVLATLPRLSNSCFGLKVGSFISTSLPKPVALRDLRMPPRPLPLGMIVPAGALGFQGVGLLEKIAGIGNGNLLGHQSFFGRCQLFRIGFRKSFKSWKGGHRRSYTAHCT